MEMHEQKINRTDKQIRIILLSTTLTKEYGLLGIFKKIINNLIKNIMKFLVMDSNVFYGNIMPCKLYVDMLSGLYKTLTIPFNDYVRDEECFVVEFEDINSIVRLSLVLNKPITIGKRVNIPSEVKAQFDSTMLIGDRKKE